jgi:hypothetical protein
MRRRISDATSHAIGSAQLKEYQHPPKDPPFLARGGMQLHTMHSSTTDCSAPNPQTVCKFSVNLIKFTEIIKP